MCLPANDQRLRKNCWQQNSDVSISTPAFHSDTSDVCKQCHSFSARPCVLMQMMWSTGDTAFCSALRSVQIYDSVQIIEAWQKKPLFWSNKPNQRSPPRYAIFGVVSNYRTQKPRHRRSLTIASKRNRPHVTTGRIGQENSNKTPPPPTSLSCTECLYRRLRQCVVTGQPQAFCHVTAAYVCRCHHTLVVLCAVGVVWPPQFSARLLSELFRKTATVATFSRNQPK